MSTTPPPTRLALANVRVFNGDGLTGPTTVVIDGEHISTDPAGAEVIDAAGATLLPGFIDAHIHLADHDTLRRLAAWGVTTGLDMATWPPELVASLRDAPGLTDIRSAGLPAIGPNGPHTHIPGMPPEAILREPAQAEPFVAARLAEGADYIKTVTEAPGNGGPDQSSLDALVAAAHAHGALVVAHAAAADAVAMAQRAGADVITHVPLDRALDDAVVASMAADRQVAVPTLTMMEGTAHNPAITNGEYRHARDSVTALHRAGVPILAGTDANSTPGTPAQVEHGAGLHRELELLVEAGLSTLDALRAATTLPAKHFGLTDRGSIQPGNRADLVLVGGDPLADITATRRIRHVWCAGTRFELD